MLEHRTLWFAPLALASGCAAPAPALAPAQQHLQHHAPGQGPAPAQHACAPVAPDGPQMTIAKASVNGRPEVRYYVIGDA
jgi:hypothetical protein